MRWFLFFLLVLLPTSATAIEKMDCGGTEPFWSAKLTDRQVTLELFGAIRRSYPTPLYSPAAGAPQNYVMSVRAKSRASNLTAFVVNQTLMVVADKNGKAPSDRTAYQAYCSDGMSDLAFPFSADYSWRRGFLGGERRLTRPAHV